MTSQEIKIHNRQVSWFWQIPEPMSEESEKTVDMVVNIFVKIFGFWIPNSWVS